MRPYLANYAIGLLFVMSMHMLFNGVSALLFPSVFGGGYIGGNVFQFVYIGIGVTEALMLVMLLLKSGIAYRITLVLLAGLIVLNVCSLFNGDILQFDLQLQGILGTASFALLLMPNVRKYYREWTIGKMPAFEA